MFTIKFYSADGFRQIIKEADSFTILRGPNDPSGSAEITLHQKNAGDDCRYDVGSDATGEPGSPQRFAKAIIENSAGRTTEIVQLNRLPNEASGGIQKAA